MKRIIYFRLLSVMAGALLLVGGNVACKDTQIDEFQWNLERIRIPATGFSALYGNDFTIVGTGFRNGDKIRVNGEKQIHTLVTKSVSDSSITLEIPDDMFSGKYDIYILRDENTKYLGTATFSISPDFPEIPDQQDKDIKGYVYSGGNRIPNVVVSDGFTVTTTDQNGVYYLKKHEKAAFVFISIPGNYEVNTQKNIPVFFSKITAGDQVQQHDFMLLPTDNEKHVVLAAADFHMANRTNTNDMRQFQEFVNDANDLISEYESRGGKTLYTHFG